MLGNANVESHTIEQCKQSCMEAQVQNITVLMILLFADSMVLMLSVLMCALLYLLGYLMLEPM